MTIDTHIHAKALVYVEFYELEMISFLGGAILSYLSMEHQRL